MTMHSVPQTKRGNCWSHLWFKQTSYLLGQL